MKTPFIAFAILLFASRIFAGTPPAIIPAPQQMELHRGQFTLSPGTRIIVDAD